MVFIVGVVFVVVVFVVVVVVFLVVLVVVFLAVVVVILAVVVVFLAVAVVVVFLAVDVVFVGVVFVVVAFVVAVVIAFVVVLFAQCSWHHIHIRFFPEDGHKYQKNNNALAGTVVDHGIITLQKNFLHCVVVSGINHPTEGDFYLLSHEGIQGTSRPCHYQVFQLC